MGAYTTIDDTSLYFQIATWTGTGSSNSITLPGDTNMQPDMSWIKREIAHQAIVSMIVLEGFQAVIQYTQIIMVRKIPVIQMPLIVLIQMELL